MFSKILNIFKTEPAPRRVKRVSRERNTTGGLYARKVKLNGLTDGYSDFYMDSKKGFRKSGK